MVCKVKEFIASLICADGFAVKWIVATRIRGVQVERPQIDDYI